MKKQVFILLVALLAIGQSAFAYDFSAIAPTGQTLYYDTVNGHAKVVHRGDGYGYVGGDLVIPDSVTYNGTTYPVTALAYDNSRGSFNGCSSLTSVTIPNSVTSIGDGAFRDCYGLTSLTIGSGVTSIGNIAFYNCSGLTSVNYTGTIAQWCNIDFSGSISNPIYYADSLNINETNVTNLVIPESVTIIKQYAFYYCNALTSVTIPNSVTSIGNSAFSGCSGLTSVTIGNGTTSIGEDAFRGCDHLTNITLGSSLQSIGNAAFYQCTQVVRIKSYAPIAPTVQSNTFYGLSDNVILNVPCGYGTIYENAAYWHRFDIQEDLLYTFSAISGDPSRGTVQIIHSPTCDNAEAEIQANPYHGFHFVCWSDGDTHIHRYLVVVQDTAIQAEFAEGSGTEGIDDLKADEPKVYSIDGRIVVEGATDEVHVYDMMGRLTQSFKQSSTQTLPAGVYMVKVGDLPARRVVVLR